VNLKTNEPQKPDQKQKLCNAKEMAQMLSLTPYRVKDLARRSAIPSIRLGHRTLLFSPEKVLAALEAFELIASTSPRPRRLKMSPSEKN
jgi:hypothetical protein